MIWCKGCFDIVDRIGVTDEGEEQSSIISQLANKTCNHHHHRQYFKVAWI